MEAQRNSLHCPPSSTIKVIGPTGSGSGEACLAQEQSPLGQQSEGRWGLGGPRQLRDAVVGPKGVVGAWVTPSRRMGRSLALPLRL